MIKEGSFYFIKIFENIKVLKKLLFQIYELFYYQNFFFKSKNANIKKKITAERILKQVYTGGAPVQTPN